MGTRGNGTSDPADVEIHVSFEFRRTQHVSGLGIPWVPPFPLAVSVYAYIAAWVCAN